MAVTFVSSTSDSTTASTLSFSHTVPNGTDRLLLVLVGTRGGPITSATYGGQTLSTVTGVISGPLNSNIYSLVNPDIGTANVELGFTVANGDASIVIAVSLTGVLLSDPTGDVDTDSGFATEVSTTVTSESGGLVIDIVTGPDAGAGATPTIGAGQTEIYGDVVPSTRVHASYETGATSVTMTWTGFDNENWCQAVAAINPQPARVRGAARPIVAPNRRVML